MNTESIGQILLRDTELTSEQLDLTLRLQQKRRPHIELGQLLIEKGFISFVQLYQALACQWELPFADSISPDQLSRELVKNIPLEFLKKHRLLPIVDKENRITIALADPLNVEAFDAVSNLLGRYCPRVICPPGEIEQAISKCYYHNISQSSESEDGLEKPLDNNTDNIISHAQREDLLNIDQQAPIVKMVNTILFQAVNHRASDIHIEQYEQEVKVRFRIDGVLHDVFTPPKHQVAALISRMKIMANLNIAEHRLPQDGQSRIKIGSKEMDIRVSIIPTSGGERVVLRLLDKGGPGLTLENFGFDRNIRNQFNRLIHSPHGIILLTGPTGSGKTTTLYCAINELNNHERNILTVEDPIEYQLPGVGQMQIKPGINLTFANCLRHILRQDPDVIMIGEIRDVETAEIAIHASLTGHLVLSTLHTNDSASAVTRLIDMGIEPYLISSSLLAVMAQRLLRVICPHCKAPCKIEPNYQQIPEFLPDALNQQQQFYTGLGCSHCLETGYFDRTGIFELMVVDEDIKELIIKQAPAHLIKESALKKGTRSLRQDGIRQALAGITTIDEVLRVTQDSLTPDIRTTEHVGIGT
ncbi:MAG: type II secretion system ATPase GspE [Sedimentisphaerales bacterium]|nr:type II secretion system ATPase GspE [Sedimentisphaerales bacterium]